MIVHRYISRQLWCTVPECTFPSSVTAEAHRCVRAYYSDNAQIYHSETLACTYVHDITLLENCAAEK